MFLVTYLVSNVFLIWMKRNCYGHVSEKVWLFRNLSEQSNLMSLIASSVTVKTLQTLFHVSKLHQVVSIGLFWVSFMPFLYNGVYFQYIENKISPPPSPLFLPFQYSNNHFINTLMQSSFVSHTHIYKWYFPLVSLPKNEVLR